MLLRGDGDRDTHGLLALPDSDAVVHLLIISISSAYGDVKEMGWEAGGWHVTRLDPKSHEIVISSP